MKATVSSKRLGVISGGLLATIFYAGSAGAAVIVDETDMRNTGTLLADLDQVLNFDGYQGTGTVVEVMVTLTGSMEDDIDGNFGRDGDDSIISLRNTSDIARTVTATTSVNFFFSSTGVTLPTNPTPIQASTGSVTVDPNSALIIDVSGSAMSMATFTGTDLTDFLDPFSINVSTITGLTLLGGGGIIEAGQTTYLKGNVEVQYKIEENASVPVPGSLALLLAGLAGVGYSRKRSAQVIRA